MNGLEYMKTFQSIYACRRQKMEKKKDFKTGEKERERERERGGTSLSPALCWSQSSPVLLPVLFFYENSQSGHKGS